MQMIWGGITSSGSPKRCACGQFTCTFAHPHLCKPECKPGMAARGGGFTAVWLCLKSQALFIVLGMSQTSTPCWKCPSYTSSNLKWWSYSTPTFFGLQKKLKTEQTITASAVGRGQHFGSVLLFMATTACSSDLQVSAFISCWDFLFYASFQITDFQIYASC